MSSTTATISPGSWVLVTGATGFVASHVIRQFLQRGYRVRGTVRDRTQAQWLIDDHFQSYFDDGYLELVTVPELSDSGAFDSAVRGVSAIVHIATISAFDPDPNNVVPQTVASVTSLLNAALKEETVRRFVFTSSIVAATLPLAGLDTRVNRDTWNETAVKAAWAPPPYEPSRAFMVYATSKVAAEKELWNLVEKEKPNFTVNVISPSGIVGEPNHPKHADNGSNWILKLWRGEKDALDAFPAAYFVDVKDVAVLHVAATLDTHTQGARLQVWGRSSNWNEFLAALRKLRPQKSFISDYPDPYYLEISADQSKSVELLKKWADQDGWRPLEASIADSIGNHYFQFK